MLFGIEPIDRERCVVAERRRLLLPPENFQGCLGLVLLEVEKVE